jgi:hypothetical protein
MKIYKDKNLTQELVEILDFGILEAGNTKQFTFYILNDTNAHLKELEFTIEHKELKILEYPQDLTAQTVGKLIIEWNPSITLKEGLKANLRVSGKELWG